MASDLPFDPDALKAVIEAGNADFVQNSMAYIFDCPRCGKSRKLYVRKEDGRCRCWVCQHDGVDGRAEVAMVLLYGHSWSHWEAILRGGSTSLGALNVEWHDHFGQEEDLIMPKPEFYGWEWPPDVFPCASAEGSRGMAYLQSRGLAEAVVAAHGIRYRPRDNRVIFPFHLNGELVGWQARLCGPDVRTDSVTGKSYKIPKALTELQPGIPGNYVMFGDGLRTSMHCILAEGPMDALKAHLCGGYVAALGKGMVSQNQLKWIAARVSRLYIALDPDASQDILRICRDASFDMETYLLMPPGAGREKKDLGECTPEEVLEAFRKAPKINGNNMILSFGGELVF